MTSVGAVHQPRRLAIFTHDTHGLGHLRRSLHIIRQLNAARDDLSILLITGCPVVPLLGELPGNADLLKLPSIAKASSNSSNAQRLGVPLKTLRNIRRGVTLEALMQFAPEVLLVDNFPLGSRKELLPVLSKAREAGIKLVLGLRDIVDDPDYIRSEWTRQGVYQVLEEVYDRILVYGTGERFDPVAAYAMPEAVQQKIAFCGYVTSDHQYDAQAARAASDIPLPEDFVLVAAGGGGDGVPLIDTFLDTVRAGFARQALVVLGPMMDPVNADRLTLKAAGLETVRVVRSVTSLEPIVAAADAAVLMAGYNSVAEALAQGTPLVLVPRAWRHGLHGQASAKDSGEQVMRARILAETGLAEMVHPDDLTPARLSTALERALVKGRSAPTAVESAQGAHNAAREILDMLDLVRPSRDQDDTF